LAIVGTASGISIVVLNYFPKDRAGLKAYDPAGYALVEKLWGISGDPSPSSSNERKVSEP